MEETRSGRHDPIYEACELQALGFEIATLLTTGGRFCQLRAAALSIESHQHARRLRRMLTDVQKAA